MEEVLGRLERREQKAEELVRELDEAVVRAERLGGEVELREQALKKAERTAQDRAREDARRLVLEARSEVDDAIRELRSGVEEGESLDELSKNARRRVEGAVGRYDRVAKRDATGASASLCLSPGDRVRISSTGTRGEVVELRGDRALVEVGALRFEVALTGLEQVEGPRASDSPPEKRGGSWSGPTKGQARLEVDLRGMRIDEMTLELNRALDDALFEDLSDLRIIHGKGTGALRKRVAEVLQMDARVHDFRMGGPTEGGAGVTVVNFGVEV